MRYFKARIYLFSLLLLIGLPLLTACESFLDEKPDKQLVIPSTLADLQALLDNYITMNQLSPVGAAETSADNYYLTYEDWAALSNESEQRKYIWAPDNLFHIDYYPNDWNNLFNRVYPANVVLEYIEGIPRNTSNAAEWDRVKGQAHFHRGQAFLNGAFTWTLAYEAGSAPDTPGMPLRLGIDFNLPSVRASLEETYTQIISDLQQAARLLPTTPVHVMRPSRPAAYAMLARTFLSMGRYAEAGAYADSSLALYDRLLDYNTLDPAAAYPFERFNVEVLHESAVSTPQPLQHNVSRIDTALFRQYAEDDLRKTLFFQQNPDGSHSFRGNYEGSAALFGGIATDEVYLMQAESRARAGNTEGAMESLNRLLVTRWRTGTFSPYTAATADEALNLVLQERRKELLMRSLRWMDIKRLNREGAAITLTRVLGDQVYTLPPGDLRFALPLPEDVIELSGMQQNPR
ncbi:RagB/SusD family nutrient uptake outer membrane protein [Pontibacter mangrovi]|uniref:RagB/SusD family nutrient uptake outer membrane protein n=1 Tax=Pontibacter mangrovi TaxID=2589816 RepID=A0A501W2V6_9BACT|nr:RagB/SusD family nutrient uptake outer membrane protein [Pontibacter mangrovi]TPE42414.1 RagB/SusD family nutrient uptake outer membrane protein [Pontibacter mangrovi]